MLLEVYTWMAAAVIAAFIAAISLFYQKKFDETVDYYFFLIPVLMSILAIIQIFDHRLPLTNVAGIIVGILFFLFSVQLYRHMTREGT